MPDYKPDPLGTPKSLGDLTSYITRELERIGNALQNSQDRIEPLAAEPTKKHEFMIVAADGFHWNPGSGKGVYVWHSGAWHYVSAVGEVPPEDPPDLPDPEPIPDPDLEAAGSAIQTFNCIGVYWTPPRPAPAGANLQYKKAVDSVWLDALPLWYDARNGECRGSIVGLDSGTTYDVRFAIPGDPYEFGLRVDTWPDVFPEGTVTTDAAGTRTSVLNITEGGTPTAYRVYSGNSLATTIERGEAGACVEVAASYVIIRGYNLRGGKHAIRIGTGVHDVVIENNDIAGWSQFARSQEGFDRAQDYDSAVYVRPSDGNNSENRRIIVQRNEIHDPRYGSNSWATGHPYGAYAVMLWNTGGNHVIRYNTVKSADRYHFFKDCVGGGSNFDNIGSPGPDTDIYGNIFTSFYDDGVEAEGGGRNVRIFANYIDGATGAIACTPVEHGPLYVFRNVCNHGIQYPDMDPGSSNSRGVFLKARDVGAWGSGRRYVFHNTVMQPPPAVGGTLGLGVGRVIVGANGEPLTNTVIRNNILIAYRNTERSVDTWGGTTNDVNYDLYNGRIAGQSGMEVNGIKVDPSGASSLPLGPVWKAGHGPEEEHLPLGKYQLEPGSPGHDAGVVLPNFNDGFLGVAPDMGAHEEGTSDMAFGTTA